MKRSVAMLFGSCAPIVFLFGACTVVTIGVGATAGVRWIFDIGVAFCVIGVALGVAAWRAGGQRRLLRAIVVCLVILVPLQAFYLMYNSLPPFQVSDSSGAQWTLRRAVPGEVRYADGYTVTVSLPTVATIEASASRVIVVPVRFSNERSDGSAHVGRCDLYVDGQYRDPYRQRPEVKAKGDIDRGVVRFRAGEGFDGRVAFEVPAAARDLILSCHAKVYVTARFDLGPWYESR